MTTDPPSHRGPPASARRYRWLEVGRTYTYSARPGKGDDARRGLACVVLVVPQPGTRGPRNVRVRFEDGTLHVVPSGVLRARPAEAVPDDAPVG